MHIHDGFFLVGGAKLRKKELKNNLKLLSLSQKVTPWLSRILLVFLESQLRITVSHF